MLVGPRATAHHAHVLRCHCGILGLEAYNAAKMALYHYIYLLLIKQLKYLL
jgi:hypothetical protein